MQLNDFLREWLAWAEGPEIDEHPAFSRINGLCYNIRRWAEYHNLDARKASGVFQDLSDRLHRDFPMQAFPFHHAEIRKHLNPARLAWVRKEIENAQSS